MRERTSIMVIYKNKQALTASTFILHTCLVIVTPKRAYTIAIYKTSTDNSIQKQALPTPHLFYAPVLQLSRVKGQSTTAMTKQALPTITLILRTCLVIVTWKRTVHDSNIQNKHCPQPPPLYVP